MNHFSIEKVVLNKKAILAIVAALNAQKRSNEKFNDDTHRDIAYNAEHLAGIFSNWDVSEDVSGIEINVINRGQK